MVRVERAVRHESARLRQQPGEDAASWSPCCRLSGNNSGRTPYPGGPIAARPGPRRALLPPAPWLTPRELQMPRTHQRSRSAVAAMEHVPCRPLRVPENSRGVSRSRAVPSHGEGRPPRRHDVGSATAEIRQRARPGRRPGGRPACGTRPKRRAEPKSGHPN